ncbi:MAG: hypothetical protein COV41_01610 [Candidatus Brennerbacteria bacterium CG11_big_fil_rev_8_21_14_0_20_43_10]|uniref:Archease domain-containing protein n=3 Tax=Candidatus Brenneribacteriota TaxID=1817902 RepID=A0A2M8C114_9BACT|nr:MAG: hypothetical protein AUJ43_00295 [Parcubacteria group bacterium CG1_02_44_31]PIR26377.1 MAG: hypothetical protein COV41_01610 [Candidatus Brennerbacteria bacterium CG11_big_fil_rev_8_21_14_0_20_43_10]PIX29070.1 MAG: hypothetical protein COZ64_01100 [Candidatus Brennerbacteria bacterium CG_4_8_14_3_um_filter_43_14]PJA19529.1 MAG: hypothetical protein COX61_00930 [Candidatus Brennerbacteria bacterium CG_4_10_14_0_2_um_filter_43_14]PJB49799.1 MAG: hypothetical protein CO102_02950 [Candidat
MKPFEIMEHTADVRLRVQGKGMEEFFTNAVAGLYVLLIAQDTVPEVYETWGQEIPFHVSSKNRETLLVDFLNEALFIAQTKRKVPVRAVFEYITNTHAKGSFISDAHALIQKDVKAVTYHDLKIITNKEGELEVVLTFDI